MVFSNVIILSLRSRLIYFTLTLIVPNITKPHPLIVYCLVLLSPFKCLRNQVAKQPKETTGSGDENGFCQRRLHVAKSLQREAGGVV